jgi:hypothetical protein
MGRPQANGAGFAPQVHNGSFVAKSEEETRHEARNHSAQSIEPSKKTPRPERVALSITLVDGAKVTHAALVGVKNVRKALISVNLAIAARLF